MHARNRTTKAAITGTLETIQGRCVLIEDAFRRDDDGRIVHAQEGGTEMFWDSSTQMVDANGHRIYLDENGDAVAENEIELYDEAAADSPAAANGATPTNGATPGSGSARGTAERFIRLVAGDVASHEAALAAARDTSRAAGEADRDSAVTELQELFERTAAAEVSRVEVSTGLIDASVARDAQIADHARIAVIHFKSTRPLALSCSRDNTGFRVDKVAVVQDGDVAEVEPEGEDARRMNAYANAILHGWAKRG